MCLCFFACVMLLSTKGYYSMSPYDDGYVSFMFSSLLPVIAPVPMSHLAFDSLWLLLLLSLSLCLPPFPSLQTDFLAFLYTQSIFPAVVLWFLLDCPSLKGCYASLAVRMTTFVRPSVKLNSGVSFRAYLIIK